MQKNYDKISVKTIEKNNIKAIRSKYYNYCFDKVNGTFMRWGKTYEDDPIFSPIGPEIADIELTTKCDGIKGIPCSFCYKSNTPNGKSMSFSTFKQIFDKLPYNLTQIAFGIDSQARKNKDLIKILSYTRKNGVIPNITISDLTYPVAEIKASHLVKFCGAIAVSRYDDKNVCYDTIEKLTKRINFCKKEHIEYSARQINMHLMISEETSHLIDETIDDILNDSRLKDLNSIVFLSLKQKGRGSNFSPLSPEKFTSMVKRLNKENISYGFDSCSGYKFIESINKKQNEVLINSVEPCESGRMSIYIDVEGKVYPCSFCEKIKGSYYLDKNDEAFDWSKGIDMLKIDNFLKDVWYHPKIVEWRYQLINTGKGNLNKIQCPIYEI